MNKDPMSIFIGDSVDYVKSNYDTLILKTKKLFFKALIEEMPVKEFVSSINKIWGNIDHEFMKERIKELEKMVEENNTKGHKVIHPKAKYEEVYKIDPESIYQKYETKYAKDIANYYDKRLETIKQGFVDKKVYLSNYVSKYDDYQKNIPYYNKNGTIRSYHNVASYNSMVYNTNLNKSGWNRTNYDSKLLDNDLVYLPAHPFACPLCMEWQGRVYSKSGRSKTYLPQEAAIEGGVGHPNCKHQWTLYWDESQIQSNDFKSSEWEEKYDSKQKIRAVELERTKLKTDMAIYKDLQDYENYDKAKSKITILNDKIKELKEGL